MLIHTLFPWEEVSLLPHLGHERGMFRLNGITIAAARRGGTRSMIFGYIPSTTRWRARICHYPRKPTGIRCGAGRQAMKRLPFLYLDMHWLLLKHASSPVIAPVIRYAKFRRSPSERK